MAIRRALISVSDKTGIVDFSRELVSLGVEIISTGGTKSLLTKNAVPVVGISDFTGFPEILDGRVKTLHPAVHSGLLAVRDSEDHREQMKKLDLRYIDMVVVNLYPFQETIANPGVTYEEAIENIDIGGPTMLRSAAKNHAFVTVVVDAADYADVIAQLKSSRIAGMASDPAAGTTLHQSAGTTSDQAAPPTTHQPAVSTSHQAGDTTLETRRKLAAKVFRHTAAYDALISDYLSKQMGEPLPERYTVTYEKVQDLRYGENPHQKAAFYRKPLAPTGNITTAEQIHGKELSYNNINDANAALQILKEFTEPAVVAVKHMNPCGVGIGDTIHQAYQKAYAADPTSIFGGIVAANRSIGLETANLLSEIFLEIVIAPDFSSEALEVLMKKKNIRLLKLGIEAAHAVNQLGSSNFVISTVEGGMLIQEGDTPELDKMLLKTVTEREPTEEEMKQLLFSWKVVKHVKSNAIVLVKDNMTIGVGAGQMNRVGAAKIAIEQAGDQAKGSIMASDAFFPMGDTVEMAAKAGITAIIQPGGSIKDEESIKAADANNIAMIFTGSRHFKH